jgi:transposase
MIDNVFPLLRGLAKIQSSELQCLVVSFHSQRSAATRSSKGIGLREVSVLQLPMMERLERAITEAVKLASPALQQVINDLQALRGITDISAVTIAAELGQVSRFDSARQLMGYCGAVPSEDSSGKRTRRGSINKTGNAHLR